MFGFENAQFKGFLQRFGNRFDGSFAVAQTPDVRTDGIENHALFAFFGRKRQEETQNLGKARFGRRDDEQHAPLRIFFFDDGIAKRLERQKLFARAGPVGLNLGFDEL